MSTAALLALVLLNPVGGPVTRAFDLGRNPYEGGRHRGADLAASAGAPVRAACGGTVVAAGRVGTSGGVVTVRCDRWRVTHMPLGTIAVRRGAVVQPGEPLGAVARSRDHAGLHLGVRRDGSRFRYADPLRFMSAAERTPAPLLGPAPRRSRRGPRPRIAPPPRAAPRTAHVPRSRAAPRSAVEPDHAGAPAPGGGLAPWPAWAGLALVLAGAGMWHGRREGRGGPTPAPRIGSYGGAGGPVR